MDAMTFLWLNQHIGRCEQMIVTLFKAAGNTISDFEAQTLELLTTDLQVRTKKFDPHKQHTHAPLQPIPDLQRDLWRIQMSLIEHAIAVNHKNAEHHDPSLANKPAPKIAILTCMDPRLNQLLEWLEIKPADADVIRNVGTAATEDVVRSLMFSIHVLGVREVMIIGHTGCGMELFSEESFEKHLHTQCGVWAVAPDRFHFYTDVNLTTQKQVLKLRSHPWIPADVVIRGFVFDLSTGELKEVTAKDDR